MRQKIAVGGENFITLRNAGSYYVDKTELLYDLVEGTDNTVTLFTRPRRFGKTLTMSMFESFFSIEKKNKSGVFSGLRVLGHSEFCEKYMNQYPVLFISLKDVEGLSFDIALDKLKAVLADISKRHAEIGNDERTDPDDRSIFARIKAKAESAEEVQNALKTIMRMMNAVYEKPVILLIDEYDVPLAKAEANGYYRQMLDVIRGMMSTSLKTNEYLEFAVVTGCLRVPKESIFTGVNNFASYSVLDNRFSQYFGFTDEEVRTMLAAFGLSDKADIIREWYDGYQFGTSKVYCPWDVVNYVSDLLYDKDTAPQNYWENTSGNDALKVFFEMRNIDFSDKFEILLNGGSLTETVTNTLTYDQIYTSEQNLWSVLLMTGYITTDRLQKGNARREGPRQADIRIPNREIADIFRSAVVDHFNRTVNESTINELMDAMWEGNEEAASEILSGLLWNTISYNDYKEDYYHAFLAGIFVGHGGYSVRSNKESGEGRPDIDLRDKANRRAMIIEAKISDRRDRMEYWCDDAISQIIRNGYARYLDDEYEKVICYGISFYKKSAMVKRMRG